MNIKKKEITEEQKNEIESIKKKYGSEISIEQSEVSKVSAKIDILAKEKKELNKKIANLKSLERRAISLIKDSDRIKMYEKVDVIQNHTYFIDSGKTSLSIGNYHFFSSDADDGIIKFDITVEGETLTQYKLFLSFVHPVEVYNPGIRHYSRYSRYRGGKTNTLVMNLKKLNFQDFLSEYSKGFKREISISNLVD